MKGGDPQVDCGRHVRRMFGMVRFLVVAGVVVLAVSALSVAWPMVTPAPKPRALESVAQIIRGTPLEERLTDVLGAGTTSAREKVTDTSTSLVSGFSELLSDRINVIVGSWTVDRIVPVYNTLPEEKKEILREAVCSVPEATESAE